MGLSHRDIVTAGFCQKKSFFVFLHLSIILFPRFSLCTTLLDLLHFQCMLSTISFDNYDYDTMLLQMMRYGLLDVLTCCWSLFAKKKCDKSKRIGCTYKSSKGTCEEASIIFNFYLFSFPTFSTTFHLFTVLIIITLSLV